MAPWHSPDTLFSSQKLIFLNSIVPFLIVRLVSFPHHHLSTDPSFTLTYFTIWSQVALYVALMITTIPCLRPFIAGLNTSHGAFDTNHVAQTTHGYSSESNGYSSGKKKHTWSRLAEGAPFGAPPNPSNMMSSGKLGAAAVPGNQAHVSVKDGNSIDTDDSQAMVIRKDVGFEIKYNTP